MLYSHDLPSLPPAAKDAEEATRLNCALVASVAIEVEKHARNKPIDEVVVPLYGARHLGYDTRRLALVLTELFLFALARHVRVSFSRRPCGALAPTTSGTGTDEVAPVCLFSGGVDSYVGLMRAAQSYGCVTAVFCAHSDQAKIIALVRRLARRFAHYGSVDIKEIRVPPLGARGYVQLRGFLYVVAAGQVLADTGSATLLVTECGPTMFQPRFSPLDSVTMTTHPMVMRLAEESLSLLLRRRISVVTPHRQLTKAEVMASSPEKEGLRRTHSCISQRFGDHDGTCFGCVIRRLAAIAAGIDDVRYRRNPLWDSRASGGNLLELLRFSADLLVDPGRLDDFQRRPISLFGVEDLFRRFGLDNMAAVYSIERKGGRLRKSIKAMVAEVVSVIGIEPLETRLSALRGHVRIA